LQLGRAMGQFLGHRRHRNVDETEQVMRGPPVLPFPVAMTEKSTCFV
jgi:hypothetical protein